MAKFLDEVFAKHLELEDGDHLDLIAPGQSTGQAAPTGPKELPDLLKGQMSLGFTEHYGSEPPGAGWKSAGEGKWTKEEDVEEEEREDCSGRVVQFRIHPSDAAPLLADWKSVCDLCVHGVEGVPEDAKIVHLHALASGEFFLTVCHPAFDEVPEGDEIPCLCEGAIAPVEFVREDDA